MDPLLEALQAILKKEALAQEQRNSSRNWRMHQMLTQTRGRKTPIRAIPAPATRPWQK